MPDPKFVAASAVALTVTLVAIFSLRPLAPRLGLVDRPHGRKCHRGRVPLIGGLCFFLGTLAGLVYLGYLDDFVVSLLVISTLILLTGLVDDLRDISVRSRLTIQACAAGLVIASTGVYVDSLGEIFGRELGLHVLGIPFTIIAVVGLMNAFNMLDGIDGLAGSLAIVSILAIMAFTQSSLSALGVVMLLQILFVAIVPYLGVNMGWPDGRKIFMGDAGSTVIGFLLAWSLIFMSQRQVAVLAPADVLWCIALPVFDTLAVIVRRLRKGYSPFKADRKHLHHLLLDAGLTARTSLAIIVGFAGGLAVIGYMLRGVPDALNVALFLTLLALYMSQLERALGWMAVLLRSPLLVGKNFAVSTTTDIDGQFSEDSRLDIQSQPLARQALAEGAQAESRLPQEAAVKVLCIASASADVIDIAPVMRRLYSDKRFDAKVCVPAFARKTANQVFRPIDIFPAPSAGTTISDRDQDGISPVTLKRVLSEYRPDVVLVHADTATTLSATAVAYGQQIPVAHLRGVPKSPKSTILPGMGNRRISGIPLHMSVPSNRETDGDAERIALSDRSTLSELLKAVTRIRQDTDLRHELRQRLGFKYSRTPLVLVAHRESDDFEHVRRAVRKVSSKLPDISIAYSVHLPIDPDMELSPPGWKVMNGHVVERLDCLTFGCLLDAAHVVLTDSSDIQEAADRLGKPTLTLRGVADDPDAASDGSSAQQSDIHELAITEGVMTLLSDTQAYEAMSRARQCSCDSDDCLRVIEALASVPLETPPIAA